MKKISKLLILSALFFVWLSVSPGLIQAQETKKAIYFYSQDCPRCQEAENYLVKNKFFEKYEIKKIDVSGPYNLGYLNEFFDALGVNEDKRGWPVIFFGSRMLIGSQAIVDDFADEMDLYGNNEIPTPDEIGGSVKSEKESNPEKIENIKLARGVLLNAALVDSINPCMMGVIMVLFFANLNLKSKKDILICNLFFIAGLSLMYFFFGVYAYINDVSEIPARFSLFVGIMIILAGMWGLKNVFTIGRFFRLHVDIKALYEQKKLFVNFITVRMWMLFLGMGAFLLLIPSATSPYLEIINLFPHQSSAFKNILYLIFYNLIFILPLAALAWFFSTQKFEQLKAKKPVLLRVVGAVIMIFTGFYLIFVPL
jgi:cytochrome c biogenesis protein CcdA